MSLTNRSGLYSPTTPPSYPCELEDDLYVKHADIIIGSVHIVAGTLALFGNGIVFVSYLKEAGQRASACMFVQLAIAGLLVGYTSIYGGVYLLRGRNHICQIVENFPDFVVKQPTQHFFELSVGHTWWYGYTCTIMLVTTLSAIRAWSIARPFKYKIHSSKISTETVVLSGCCWFFGAVWIGARYLVKCQWLLQTFFTYSVPHCPNSLGYKLIVFPLDVVPVLCGTLFTIISNTYVISELARSYRNPPPSQQTRETFSKTTLLIVLLTSFFLLCYTPTLIFYMLNSLEIVTNYDSRFAFISQMNGDDFITAFSLKFLIPTLYPALSPILQYCGANRQRERFTNRAGASFLSAMAKGTGRLPGFRRTTRSTQVMGQTLTLPMEQTSPQMNHTAV